MFIEQVSILLIDLLFLSLNILFPLLVDLAQNTQQHLVTLLLIVNLSLLCSLHIVEIFQFQLLLLQLPPLSLLSAQLILLVFLYSVTLVLEEILPGSVILCDLFLKLLQLPPIFFYCLILFIDLLLQSTSDLHHILVMLGDVVSRTINLHCQVLKSELSLM